MSDSALVQSSAERPSRPAASELLPLVAIASRGDPRAIATGVDYRIEIAEARSFLDLMIARVKTDEL